MKFAKRGKGLFLTFGQYGVYNRLCQITSGRACYYDDAPVMCGLLDDPNIPKECNHEELYQSHIEKSKSAVLIVVSVIQSFTNP